MTEMSEYQSFIALSRYARWLPEERRRETWEETVGRYINFWKDRGQIDDSVAEELFQAKVNLEVMGSMRATMTAGKALDKDNVAGFNCSYLAVDHPRAFDETLYILMCGTGLGFSVERQFINKLPEVAESFHDTDTIINVRDSKKGWAKAYKELISLLFSGDVPKWDTSKVRGAGEKLKTFGGRASGPQPLEDLFRFTIRTFRGAAGRKLNSLECHDIMCKIADIVVVGGVRRSALISLSNLSDYRIRNAKSGQWSTDNPQRALANNSTCYTEKPDFSAFLNEWKSLHDSMSGERGMLSRPAMIKQAEKNGRRDINQDFGTNPCSEIILRPNQFCNLSEVVIREKDTLEDLKRKVRLATILGTLQATLTDFKYLRPVWRRNTEEEALLGVSLTGIMDNPVMSGSPCKDISWFFGESRGANYLEEALEELKQVAIDTNKEWAEKLGINPSVAITCVKPSGTVSQLVDSSSGIHARFSEYYIRTVRADKRDPLAIMMTDAGFPVEDCFMKGDTTQIFSFPCKSPKNSVKVEQQTALEQLRVWKVYQDYWCEHKPSVTVYYKDSEFLEVGQWLYNNFNDVSGISFLPYSDHSYEQAPYKDCDKETYEKALQAMPKEVKWSLLGEYEEEDNTSSTQTMACSGSICEIVDITS
jgi:ribonucleoside-triphosphate reductase (thioredoxin)